MSADGSYNQRQLQDVMNKADELIAALRRWGHASGVETDRPGGHTDQDRSKHQIRRHKPAHCVCDLMMLVKIKTQSNMDGILNHDSFGLFAEMRVKRKTTERPSAR